VSSEPFTDLYRSFTVIGYGVLFNCRKSAPDARGTPVLFRLRSHNEPQHYLKQHFSVSIECPVVRIFQISVHSCTLSNFRQNCCALNELTHSLTMNMQISEYNADNGRLQLPPAPVALDG
jgi:hypothetical protein